MLTTKEQLILLEMLLKKGIRRKEQKIYKSNIRFYLGMTKLKEFGLINSEIIDKKKNGEKIYFLTYPNGWARANLIAYDKNVDEKYRKISKEFRVLP